MSGEFPDDPEMQAWYDAGAGARERYVVAKALQAISWDDVDALQAAYVWIEHEWQEKSELYPGRVSFTQRGRKFTYDARRFHSALAKIVQLLPPRTADVP